MWIITLFRILSACVSNLSSSMKMQDELTTGSIMSSLFPIKPTTKAVNGICRLVVLSVHSWLHEGALASFIAAIFSPITSTTTLSLLTKLTDGNSFGVSPINISYIDCIADGTAEGDVPFTSILQIIWTTHGGHHRFPPLRF